MPEETKTAEGAKELTQDQVKKVLETQVQVKVSLLRQIATIIDVCNKRAAFKTEELEGIGAIYKTLTSAVDDVSKQVLEEGTAVGAGLSSVKE